jgi:hypothetical protein
MAGLLGKDQITICFLKNELTHKQLRAEKRLECEPLAFLPMKKSHKGSTTLPREILLRTKDGVQVLLTNCLQIRDINLYVYPATNQTTPPQLTVLAPEYETL